MKIDLSQLFGAPADGKSAEELAAIERDEQLVMAGRQAVGSATISDDRASRSKPSPASSAPDELDDLVDELNDLDL